MYIIFLNYIKFSTVLTMLLITFQNFSNNLYIKAIPQYSVVRILTVKKAYT